MDAETTDLIFLLSFVVGMTSLLYTSLHSIFAQERMLRRLDALIAEERRRGGLPPEEEKTDDEG